LAAGGVGGKGQVLRSPAGAPRAVLGKQPDDQERTDDDYDAASTVPL
jgi:hypothetical protein